jgi:NAD(P)H-hydrate epimerase
LQGDAADNWSILQQTSIEIRSVGSDHDAEAVGAWFGRAEWIVDAMLGTGARGEPRFPIDELIRRANASPARRLAIDLPSGLDCDTGQTANVTFRADHSCTLVARKQGFRAASAKPYLGHVRVLDIGVPPEVIELARNDPRGALS